MKIDEHALPIGRRYATLRGELVRVHVADRHVAPFDRKDFALTLEIPGKQRRNAVLLDEHLRPLHVEQVLGDVCSCRRAQQVGNGYRVRRHMHCSVRVDPGCAFPGQFAPAWSRHPEHRIESSTPGAWPATAPNLRSGWIGMETPQAPWMASVVRHSGVDKLQQAQGLGAPAARKFEAMTAGVQIDMQAGKFLIIAPSQIEHLIG